MTMDNTLFSYIHQKRVTPFNPIICDGLATSHLKMSEQHIATLTRWAMTNCHPEFKFEGITPCTAQEMLQVSLRKEGTRSYFEASENDLVAVKLNWSWRGDLLAPAFVFLPFTRRGALTKIRGALFAISPVLVDKSISVGVNSIFIPLNGAKITFVRLLQNVVIDNINDSIDVVWAKVYNRSDAALLKQDRKTVDASAVMMHYLLCRYGLVETFKRYAGCDVIYGDSTAINTVNYPFDDYVICRSFAREVNLKPKGVLYSDYSASDFCIAIPRAQMSTTVRHLIGGLFYIVDHFPQRIDASVIGTDEESVSLEIDLWQLLLAHVIFATDVSEGKLQQDIAPHMRSINTYVDDETRDALITDGIYATDFFDLIANIMDTFSMRVTESAKGLASMYDKRLVILRYLLSPITHAIYTMMYAIKGGKQIMDRENLNKCIKHFIKPLLIQAINHKHGEVRSISSSSDNMLFNITSAVVLQTNSSGMTPSKSKSSIGDPSRLLDASIAEVGSYAVVQKSEPTGRGRLNPTVKISATGDILRDESKRALIDSVQEMIRR